MAQEDNTRMETKTTAAEAARRLPTAADDIRKCLPVEPHHADTGKGRENGCYRASFAAKGLCLI